MSKIHSIRFINVNYNNDNIRINDESFFFDGKSSLISLENGGGKSVMIQMLMAPFVQKSRRDVADRKFSSYFLTANPSFILVEWQLDGSIENKLLTGMMVRRNQHIDENNENELEVINFISEYPHQCEWDIHHIPVIEREEGRILLKSFSECCALFESYKKDRQKKFYYYDMNNSYQSAAYFNRLMEYGIYYKEWQEIIREVNKEEGGLSKIFSECKNERKLLEKWILPKVEAKLNKEKDILADIKETLEKFLVHRHQTDSSISQKDAIVQFKEDSQGILSEASRLAEGQSEEKKVFSRISAALFALNALFPLLDQRKNEIIQQIEEYNTVIKNLNYEKDSLEYYIIEDKLNNTREEINKNEKSLEIIRDEVNSAKRIQDLHACKLLQSDLDEYYYNYNKKNTEFEIYHNQINDINKEVSQIGSELKRFYLNKHQENTDLLNKINIQINNIKKDLEENVIQSQKYNEESQKLHEKNGSLKSSLAEYERNEDDYFSRYAVSFPSSLFYSKYNYPVALFEEHQKALTDMKEGQEKELRDAQAQKSALALNAQNLAKKLEDGTEKIKSLEIKQIQEKELFESLTQERSERLVVLQHLGLSEDVLFDFDLIRDRLHIVISEIDAARRALEKKERDVLLVIQRYEKGFLDLPQDIADLFSDLEIPITYGMEWLKHQPEKDRLLQEHKFLPYSLILEEEDLEKIKASQAKITTFAPVPLLSRSSLAYPREHSEVTGDVYFYVHFPEELLDESQYAALLASLHEERKKISAERQGREEELELYRERMHMLSRQKLTQKNYAESQKRLEEIAKTIEQLGLENLNLRDEMERNTGEEKKLDAMIPQCVAAIKDTENQIEDFQILQKKYTSYLETKKKSLECIQGIQSIQKKLGELSENKRILEGNLQFTQQRSRELDYLIKDTLNKKCQKFENFEEVNELSDDTDVNILESRYDTLISAIEKELSINGKNLEEEISAIKVKIADKEKTLSEYATKSHFNDEEWKKEIITQADVEKAGKALEELEARSKNVELLLRKLTGEYGSCSTQLQNALMNIRQKCGFEEALPRDQIVEKDFRSEIVQNTELRNKRNEDVKNNDYIISNLQVIYNAYNSYLDETVQNTESDLPEYFSLQSVDVHKINKFFKNNTEKLNGLRSGLEHQEHVLYEIINDLYNKPIYDPVQKILPNLRPIAKDAQKILRDLPLKLKILDDMLGKMEKDISKIEEEKNIIINMFFEYLEMVNKQLNSIDNNSSIKIRDQAKKTLRIDIPKWEEKSGTYRIKIRDFIDTLTRESLQLLREGSPIHDYLTTRLTTKEVFDRIVGIDLVKIHLIKVEAQREVVIPWSNVTTNSGGEGFLSSFIVLSSLLSYMRQEGEDHFSSGIKNEGKVLIMDNPFGKTNASHLLKPLMEIARKNNLQLICLTGLGGDSIYDRFDNIYVLTLVPAGEEGVSLVKSTLHKGSPVSVLSLSRVQVVDENSLLQIFSQDMDLRV